MSVERRGLRFAVAGLILPIIASAFIALGVRHVRRGMAEGLSEEYDGNSVGQFLAEAGEYLHALSFMAIAGAISGADLRLAGVARVAPSVLRRRGWIALAWFIVLPITLVSPIPGILKQIAWCAAAFSLPLVEVIRLEIRRKDRPVSELPEG